MQIRQKACLFNPIPYEGGLPTKFLGRHNSYVSVNSNLVHPPAQPPGQIFERANPGNPGNFFCLIPCPGAKNDGRIPGVGQNFPKLTPYNICSVLWRLFSTLEVVQYIGG